MQLPPIPVAANTGAIRATADGSCVFVTDGVDSIYIINTSTNMLDEPPISVGRAVSGIAVTEYSCNPANRGSFPRAYAGAGSAVLEIDLSGVPPRPPPTVITGTGLIGLGTQVAITPDGKFTYVATNDFFGVSLINTDPNDPDHFHQVIGQLVNTGTARGIAISPGGSSVYVANSTGPVSRFQAGSLTPEAQIDLGTANAPRAIALTTDGEFAYVANFQSSSVSVIQTSDMTLAAGPIAIGPFPVAIAAR